MPMNTVEVIVYRVHEEIINKAYAIH